MNTLAGKLLGAVIFVAVAWGMLFWSSVERDLAMAQEGLVTRRYDGVDAALARAERFYGYVRLFPGIGDAPLNSVRANRASLLYWQQDYGNLIPPEADPIGALPPESVGAQFIVANAIFREARELSTDQPGILAAIDSGIAAQTAVLRNSPGHPEAAFNYEYLVRLRGAAAAGPATPNSGEGGNDKSALGNLGGEPQAADPTSFEIHVPLESRELQDQKEGQDAGKSPPRQRRG